MDAIIDIYDRARRIVRIYQSVEGAPRTLGRELAILCASANYRNVRSRRSPRDIAGPEDLAARIIAQCARDNPLRVYVHHPDDALVASRKYSIICNEKITIETADFSGDPYEYLKIIGDPL